MSPGPDPDAQDPSDIVPFSVNPGTFPVRCCSLGIRNRSLTCSDFKGITVSPVVTLCCWRQKLNCSRAVLRHLVEAGLEKASGDIYLKRPPDWLVAALITGKKSHHGLVGGKTLSRSNHRAIKLQCIFICCHCSCGGH